MGNTVPILHTARLTLRAFRDEDLAPFAALNADPHVMRFFPAPLSRAESDALAARIKAHFEAHGFGLFAVERHDAHPATFLGFVGLWTTPFDAPFTPCVEVGWRLAHAHWGQGIAIEAARAAVRDGFGRLGLAEVVSFTVRDNVRSRSVMERLGMRHDPSEDFLHPSLPADHALAPHVLYRLPNPGG